MLHPIQRISVPAILKLFWIRKVTGLGNLPLDEGFIITSNHSSILDDWIPSCIIVPKLNKELHIYVNRKFFRNPLFRLYLYHHKSIPVEVYDSPDKKEVNEKAFQTALVHLKNKEPVCIFPEGHRTLDGELQKARSGVARLALTAEVPVVPFGIIGSRDVWPKGRKIPKIKRIIEVKIGKPIYLDKYYGKQDNKEVLGKVTREIMQEIGKLIGKEYGY